MNKACVYFHQGWTDIICQLSLVDYYLSKYDSIKLIVRSDAESLIKFYLRDKNVELCLIETDNGRHLNHDYLKYTEGCDIMFHGQHDIHRIDKYKHSMHGPNPKGFDFFIEAFYGCYDIDYNVRVDYFNITRDLHLENKVYQEFINEHGSDYVLYHDDENNHLNGIHHISTKLDIKSEYNCINLNKISNTLFDYIKVIENAKELHLIDSIWGAFCYQLDAKYGILNDKEVYLYPLRGHNKMFEYPKKLKWIIK